MDEIGELSWPKPGEKLFRGDLPDWLMNACLNFDPEPWTGISRGYRIAGGLLVSHVAKDRGDADFLAYPVVFVYRHHLELALKYVIRLANRVLGHAVEHSDEHDLRKLWKEARSLLEQLYPGEEPQAIDGSENLIHQLAEVDERSFAFRYPVDRQGGGYIPKDLLLFNLRHFRNQMERVANFLEATIEQTLVRLQETEGLPPY
jgi:hypothetical protein